MLTKVLRGARARVKGSALHSMLVRLGVTNIARKLYERRLLRDGVHRVTMLGHSLEFAVTSTREIHRIDSFHFEQSFVSRILDALQPGDVVYDVGANIGMISCLVAASGRERGVVVHSIEPEDRNAAALRRNSQLNALTNLQVHELALGDESGTAELHVSGEAGEGTHSIIEGGSPDSHPITIQIASGEDFMGRDAPPPDVVKIDVEGFEMSVLKGLAPALDAGTVRDLFIEIHPTLLEQVGSSAEELRAWLRERGYRSVWCEQPKLEAHEHFRKAP